MTLFFTVTTLQHLPQALALGESLRQHHPAEAFVIGLADDERRLPHRPFDADILPLSALQTAPETLSEQYNPAEFVAAVKPLFLKYLWESRPDATQLVFLAPTIFLYRPLHELDALLADAALLLTPHLLRPPADAHWPDEKYVQNVGLYHAGFVALRRSEDAAHFVDWWAERTPNRAFIRFCDGMCLDQVWLMLTVGFYETTRIVRHPGWHVGLWNLHERPLQAQGTTLLAGDEPLAFLNFDGLCNRSLLFDGQTRLRPRRLPLLTALLNDYRQTVARHDRGLSALAPAFGLQPLKYPLPAWRQSLLRRLRQTLEFIETVNIPRRM